MAASYQDAIGLHSIALCSFALSRAAGTWRGQAVTEKQLRSRSQLFTSELPVSFLERFVVTASGKAYLLDTDLSTLFTLDHKNGRLKRVCGSESLSSPSDISVDGKGNVWVLSVAHSKIVRLASNCQPQAQIISRQMPLRVAANVFGELIVLNGAGPKLFEVYGPEASCCEGFVRDSISKTKPLIAN